MLHGATKYGGRRSCGHGGGCGTIFSITPSDAESVLHSFGHGNDGLNPVSRLVNLDGTLYGSAAGGDGGRGRGTIFAIRPELMRRN